MRTNVYQIITTVDDEPPLTKEEEQGLRQAYAEMAAGMGETLEEAFGDFVKA